MKKAEVITNGHLNLNNIKIDKKELSNEDLITSVEEKDKIIKKLKRALKAVVDNFPEEVLKDQMNEDYDLIEKALKK